MHRIARSLTLLLGTVGALALSTPSPAAPTTVRLAQNLSPISGVAIVAQQKGFFDKHGLHVVVSNFTSGRQALETVIGGGADFATTAEAPVTAAAMAKQRIAFLARVEYSDIKTLAAPGIAKLSDLRGKRVAYTAGTGAEVYTYFLLKQAGLAKADVKLVNLRPQDMASAMAAGSIDAYSTWEPHIGNGKRVLGAKARQLDTAGIYSETFNIVVMQDYLQANPAVVKAFLAALLEAERWMKANPSDAVAVVASAVGMGHDDLAAIWNEYVYEVVLDERTVSVLERHAGWRLETGNAPSGAAMPSLSQVIFPEPLRSLAPERVTIKLP